MTVLFNTVTMCSLRGRCSKAEWKGALGRAYRFPLNKTLGVTADCVVIPLMFSLDFLRFATLSKNSFVLEGDINRKP